MITQERMPREEIARLLNLGGYGLCGLRAGINHQLSRLISDEGSGAIIGGLTSDNVVMPQLELHPSLLHMAVGLAGYAHRTGIPYVLCETERAVAELERVGENELARTLEGL